MRDLVILLIHLIATIAKLLLPGGARSVVAESILLTSESVESAANRPNHCQSLRWPDAPTRLLHSAIVLKPSTLYCEKNRSTELL
jgi:hypothetical protein